MEMMVLYIKMENNKREKIALAGSRTRISCLEGVNADRYTTNAALTKSVNKNL